MTYKYVAAGADGRRTTGRLEARDRTDALRILRSKQLSPIRLTKCSSQTNALNLRAPRAASLPLGAWARLARSLADLIAAGVPLRDSLSLCAKRAQEKGVRAFLERVEQRVRAGSGLSAAILEDQLTAPRLAVAMIRSAEGTGELGPALTKLAESLEATAKLRRETIAQLIYPAILCVLVVLTIVFLSYFVLPQFERVFNTSSAPPPQITQIALAGGAWVRSYGWTAPFTILILTFLGSVTARSQKAQVDRLVIASPGVGALLAKLETGRFARSLGSLCAGGGALANGFPIALSVVGNTFVARELQDATDRVRSGAPLAEALSDCSSVPNSVVSLIEIGERTGRLGDMLLKAADLCAEDVRKTLGTATNLVSPVMTVLMGGVVAGVVGAVMIGVLSLNDAVY